MAGTDREHPETQHPARGGFEERDVNILAVSRFGMFLFFGLIVALFGLWGLFSYFQSQIGTIPSPSHSLRDIDVRRLPPEPRLQPTEYLDLKQMQTAEDQVLSSYAWVDPDHGVVRIPISLAMDLLAQRGLPVRAAPPAVALDPLTAEPTESGLGPAIQQAGGPLAPVIHRPPVQPLEIRGDGGFADGRQAGGPPTPPEDSLAVESSGTAGQGKRK